MGTIKNKSHKDNIFQPFFLSILGGLIVWFVVFLFTPTYVVNKIETETLVFIVLSYIFMILGYILTPLTNKNKSIELQIKHVVYIILFILVCYSIRFIDLFYYRGLRFSNTIYQNRLLAQNGPNGIILILASIFKTLFFVPLLLLLLKKKHKLDIIILALFLFFLPLVEAFIRGSRSPFLQSFIFLIIILLVTKNIQTLKRNMLLFLTVVGILFIISTQILMKREGPKNANPYIYLVTKAIYNDFLKPKEAVLKYMNNSDVSNFQKKIALSTLQIGQYYTHGVFEFDYVVKYYKHNKYQRQLGKYTFYVICKFTNKYKISNIDLEEIIESSPRKYTFISFFGGMYIDFGWFALLVMFGLGSVQKKIYNKVKNKEYYFAPLLVFLLYANFFMLTFNIFKGTGTYTLISCVIFAMLMNKYKKSNI